ncbi:MAG: CRISPR-associated protein Cas4 [Bacteroidales bacterium]|nr:CRISPR-associated protein Cas4 [Bacteroidales bacterium]
MRITGTHFNYFMVCHRKLWLFANSIQMEHTSDLVYEGKLIHETTYLQRPARFREVEIDGIKIDYFDGVRKEIHEIKKTDKLEDAHVWQLKYYLYVLQQHGVDGAKGILEYPKLRQTREVWLTTLDEETIVAMKKDIESLLQSDECPPVLKQKSTCRHCSYFDLCYATEVDLAEETSITSS